MIKARVFIGLWEVAPGDQKWTTDDTVSLLRALSQELHGVDLKPYEERVRACYE